MKTFKPNLEVLEGRALPSGLWDPGPGGGTPVPTGPLGVPILAGKGGTKDINFEPPGGAVQIGDEVIFLDQDHWERGGFEDLEDMPGVILVDLNPDDPPEPTPPGGGGGGGGILGWLGNLFGGGKNKDDKESSNGGTGVNLTPVESSLAVPPDVDVPGPNPGGGQQTLVRPPSQPGHVGDMFHNPYEGISLTPGGLSETFVATSSDVPIPVYWQANWEPGYNVFSVQPGRATGGESSISIEFTGAGVVDPRSRDTIYLRGRAETGQSVSVPDGGTVLLGAANGRGVTLVEVLAAAKTSTVDKVEVITIGG
ncbi:MAG: hypothetical protein N2039_03630 [Gemmataceae bacterium]|nr:hypothetical protein [Gemmataceae bacterium]